ncbi:MAG: DUF2577 domain-containing protein [Anaeromicrobium sp.]|jgi:hypothetical protein|uniref:DUF2577 family protein n=1 Tax=Anaeromicrobium sp. TaxID=1929132 RepID=UPI0025E9FB64|nr:DUF2577 family protein [Anaeromicrobium sp.]MCT4593189.1 DUF2577 domain-containing protein [Anaeromicrobium sp.]
MEIFNEIVREIKGSSNNAAKRTSETVGLELGTMTGERKVKLDNFKYEVSCLLSEYVTRQHKRIVTLTHEEMAQRDLGDKTENDYLDTDDKVPLYTSYKHNFIELQFEDVLKVGDRVLVALVNGGVDFVVLGRVV